MTTTSRKTVREIAIENPATIRVFETFGIDYCCGGKRSLSDACTHAKVPMDRVLELLAGAGKQAGSEDTARWDAAALSAVIAHIVTTHHEFVKTETPRIQALLTRVINRHGENHPEVRAIEELFLAVSQELATHLMKEEQVLFPYIEKMELAILTGERKPPAFFGSVTGPIASMVADHDDAGALLARIRELSSDFTVPEGACPTYRGLYQALLDFERDLHHHVHLENNILFPRAIAMERAN